MNDVDRNIFQMALKQTVYVDLFVLLGWLLSILLHAVIELPLLSALTQSYARGEMSWLATHWVSLHRFGGMMMSLGGIILGYFLGRHFWHILYVEKRYSTPR